MPIGITPNLNNLNQQAGQIALSARNALQQVLFFNNYLLTLGAAGLEGLGMAPDDATALLAIYADMAAIASTCMGEPYAGPDLPFNFMGATVPMWGGN